MIGKDEVPRRDPKSAPEPSLRWEERPAKSCSSAAGGSEGEGSSTKEGRGVMEKMVEGRQSCTQRRELSRHSLEYWGNTLERSVVNRKIDPVYWACLSDRHTQRDQ